jgi:hypothetical protein
MEGLEHSLLGCFVSGLWMNRLFEISFRTAGELLTYFRQYRSCHGIWLLVRVSEMLNLFSRDSQMT